ncbi:MAG: 30S ribosomal protein S16 [bacterium]|nr:30S ribosomal protein S16 [bacterium]
MLTIRLSRIGKKNQPLYRLIISEKTKDPYGRALEILGSYNPFTKQLQAKNDRIKYWLSKGAQMSPTVNNLLIEKKIIEGKKVTASKPGEKKKAAKPGKKDETKAKETEPEQSILTN